MHIPKKYLHDKLILLLISTNVFLAFLCLALILLRGGIGEGIDSYIIEYRSNLGLSAYRNGGFIHILSFMVFVIATLIINIILSIKTYSLRRTLALTILGLGVLVQLLAVIVSNALLALY